MRKSNTRFSLTYKSLKTGQPSCEVKEGTREKLVRRCGVVGSTLAFGSIGHGLSAAGLQGEQPLVDRT